MPSLDEEQIFGNAGFFLYFFAIPHSYPFVCIYPEAFTVVVFLFSFLAHLTTQHSVGKPEPPDSCDFQWFYPSPGAAAVER